MSVRYAPAQFDNVIIKYKSRKAGYALMNTTINALSRGFERLKINNAN